MAVAVGKTIIQDIHPGNDTYSALSVKLAETLAQARGTDYVTDAIVDRFDGLVIFSGDIDAPSEMRAGVRGWHFAAALCGYSGEGPNATATILALFDFGDREAIFEQIRHGGDRAHFHFRKGVGLVADGR